jgi:hypothetical protein
LGEEEMDDTRYESWFLHEDLLLRLLGPQEASDLALRLPDVSEPLGSARRVRILEEVLASVLRDADIPSLDEKLLKHRLRPGDLIWLEQAVAFKGVRAARESAAAGNPAYASFASPLATDAAFRVTGKFNVTWLTSQSAGTMLSGRRRTFLLGYVEDLLSSEVVLRPIAIATRWFGPRSQLVGTRLTDRAHVWPAFVDQFDGVDFSTRMSTRDLAVLRSLSERHVKDAFASIIGEPNVPNDWGGEQFDLWTTRISIQSEPVTAAFMFKGPAKFHPMTMADLGKNGDQIDRIIQTAAELVVVQHCHSITAPVVNMLRTYATHPRHMRRYMTLDGFDTVRILKHFGHL